MDKQKRKHILRTAMELFNEYGFHATPTSKIAKKARVSVGTLFNYFPTKEDLIVQIYVQIKLHSRQVFIENNIKPHNNHDGLKEMYRAIIYWGIHYPEEFKYLELFCHSSYHNIIKDEKTLEAFSKFRRSILRLIPSSTIFEEYPEYAIQYVNSSIHIATRFLLEQAVDDTNHFIDSSFELVWEGILNGDISTVTYYNSPALQS